LPSAGEQGARVAKTAKKSPLSAKDPKAVFLLATLKHKRGGGEFSHTEVLSELVIECLRAKDIRCEIIRLVDYDIPAGTKSRMGENDDWPGILEKILEAQIIVFATPIWWGNQSSLMQRTIERLDELHDELLETGKSRLNNKVGGIVITGEEDGEQHITGNISNFLINMGVTLPPHCGVSYQGSYTRATRKSLARKFREEKATAEAAEKMAKNLAFFARLLQSNPIRESGN
jgi:multimeric flavodoxin WrbA